jgi:hypothetical protein
LHAADAEPAREVSFPTPEAAAAALGTVAATGDRTALREVFGLAGDDLVATDQVQARNELTDFSAAYATQHRVVRKSDSVCVLEVGTNAWPFPVPIVVQGGRWHFDLDAGREELLNRRVGRNELAVIEVLRAYVEAQREYARVDRDGDDVLEFALRLGSSPGRTDGLYWPAEAGEGLSPLGPLVAQAQAEGYAMAGSGNATACAPFHGYFFKILKRQGRHAPGGKHDYVINGNLIAGFALVAWPADYGESGVMTFIVNQQGRVYQRDLGPKTARIAAGMRAYDPADGWERSQD